MVDWSLRSVSPVQPQFEQFVFRSTGSRGLLVFQEVVAFERSAVIAVQMPMGWATPLSRYARPRAENHLVVWFVVIDTRRRDGSTGLANLLSQMNSAQPAFLG